MISRDSDECSVYADWLDTEVGCNGGVIMSRDNEICAQPLLIISISWQPVWAPRSFSGFLLALFTKHQGLLSWLLLPLDFSLCGEAKSRVVLLIGIYSIIQFSSIFVFFILQRNSSCHFDIYYISTREISVCDGKPAHHENGQTPIPFSYLPLTFTGG